MESLILSQKSMADVKDPVIKGLIEDISAVMQAEILQAIQAVKKTTTSSRSAVGSNFVEFEQSYQQLSSDEKTRVNKLAKRLNTVTLRNRIKKLGLDLNKDVLASEQIDFQKSFAHLKGQEAILANKLDTIGQSTVVPFTQFPDEETTELINRIKTLDKDAEGYADYMALLPKDKLIELYEREMGSIQNRSNFFKTHEPDTTEITKIRRTVAEWQKRAPGDTPKYRNRFLKLIVTRVHCIDETEHEGAWPFEGEGIANDRIDLGAISIGPNGRTRSFGPQMVSDNFEDNRQFIWNREIARFDIASFGPSYPKDFGVTVAISEIDYGAGFANTLNEISVYIRRGVVELLTKIGEVIGSILGSGEVGKFIGKIVGDLLALALGELINIIGRAVQDDVFQPQVATIRLDNMYSTFNGVLDKIPGPFRSPEQVLPYAGFGGAYRVYCVWELEREAEVGTLPINHTGNILRITTQTGGDDLRGYNTAFFSINYTNGTSSREYLLHRGHGGGQRSEQNFTLDASVTLSGIRSITIRHDGSPNWPDGYDNWNLDHLKIALINTAGTPITIHESSGAPLVRFTGDTRRFVANKQ